MRRPWIVVGAAFLGLGLWMGLYPVDWQGWLGFTRTAYFVNGQNYAFFSGIGPLLVTSLGLSTIIVGLWHSINCHYDGCMRIGRHKISGTPWCNRHHGQARPHRAAEELLQEISDKLTELLGRQ